MRICYSLALVLGCVSLLFPPRYSAQSNDPTANKKSTNCDDDSDRRYAVCRGAWSGKTVALFYTWSALDLNPERRVDVPSPDGTKILQVRGVHVRLQMNGKRYWTPFGKMHDAEVGWAPDSTRLFVTWSETGELGPWHTQVYDVTEKGLFEIPGVTRRVRPDMIHRMKKAPIPKWVDSPAARSMWPTLDYCAYDVVGSQWANGSREIVVAALAGPDSGCKYMGNFVAYRIDVATGTILQAYSEDQARSSFGKGDLPVGDPDDSPL
jgi:hypothetical protein